METGRKMGRKMAALVTDMDRPLGRTAGNALEILETVECLTSSGPADVVDLTVALGARMLVLSGVAQDNKEAESRLRSNLKSGAAAEVFRKMVKLHGGDPRIMEKPGLLPQAKIVEDVVAGSGGYVHDVDADGIGRACLVLGAGRRAVTDRIDHAVGVSMLAQAGEQVKKGGVIARIHASDRERLEEARELVEGSFTIGAGLAKRPPLILEVLE